MKNLRLDEVALWRAKLTDEMTVRENPIGRPYEDNNIIKKTTSVAYRYAKNYTVDKEKFCLFIFTYDKNKKEVEKFLNKVAKTITVDMVKKAKEEATMFSNFEWLNIKYKEEK